MTGSFPGAFNVLISAPYSLMTGQGVLHGIGWTDWLGGIALLAIALALSFGAALIGRLVGRRFHARSLSHAV